MPRKPKSALPATVRKMLPVNPYMFVVLPGDENADSLSMKAAMDSFSAKDTQCFARWLADAINEKATREGLI